MKFNCGLMRFKVVLEIQLQISSRRFVFFGMNPQLNIPIFAEVQTPRFVPPRIPHPAVWSCQESKLNRLVLLVFQLGPEGGCDDNVEHPLFVYFWSTFLNLAALRMSLLAELGDSGGRDSVWLAG